MRCADAASPPVVLALVVASAACAPAGAGPLVSAPAEGAAPPRPAAHAAQAAAREGEPDACSAPWTLENMVGGSGRVVVVCDHDVRREELDPAEMARLIGPALGPARDRVCACAARLRAPEYVDLEVTSIPGEGRATVRASDSPEDDADPELGPPFAACIGSVVASFRPGTTAACPGSAARLTYPVRIELGR